MLSKFTKRERTLAIGVMGLAPVLLAFWGFTSLSSRYFANDALLQGLTQQLGEEQLKQKEAQLALERRNWYRTHSLPADATQARIKYEAWLHDLLEKQSGIKIVSLDPGESRSLRFRRGSDTADVARQYSWTFIGQGNLEQLTKMLRGFEATRLTHRITGMNIKPLTVGGSGTDANNRTGQLKIEAEVQVLSLVDAQAADGIGHDTAPASEADLKPAQDVLVRNIFGPANNPPQITSSGSKAAESGSPVSFDVTAKDPEDLPGLRFEIVESQIEGAVLKATEDPSKMMFESPAQAVGKYSVKVRVTDAGFPPKSIEKDLTITVREPRVAEVEEVPPKPEFKHTQATRITGITLDVNGHLTCWVHVQTTDQRHRPRIGESFELDNQKWTLRSISSRDRKVVFEVENRLVTIAVGSTFDKPLSSEEIGAEPVKSVPQPDGSG